MNLEKKMKTNKIYISQVKLIKKFRANKKK